MPNVNATAQSITSKPLSDSQSVKWISYAKSCVKPGLDYFKRQLSTTMKNSLQVFKGCWLFSPHKVCAMKVDADKVKEALLPIPFLSSKVELDRCLQNCLHILHVLLTLVVTLIL